MQSDAHQEKIKLGPMPASLNSSNQPSKRRLCDNSLGPSKRAKHVRDDLENEEDKYKRYKI